MNNHFKEIMERSSMSKELRKALENAAKNHPSDIEQAANALQKIEERHYCSEEISQKYRNNLKRLCEEYYIPPQYNERLLSKQGDASRRKKISRERIAAEIGISRSNLTAIINNSRFNANPKYKNYIENRQAYLLLFSIFFEVSPLYIIGLTDDKYDYQGLFDPMCMGNSDIFACYNLIRAAYTRLELEEKASPDKLNQYISYLEPLRDLSIFLSSDRKIDTETRKLLCHEIRGLFKNIPWIEQNTQLPLPVSAEEVENETEYCLNNQINTQYTKNVFGDYLNICENVGKIDLRILISYALLVHNQKCDLLDGIRNILKSGGYTLYL